jgi:hypothetical protein
MARYKGLAIGGPKAGQRLDSDQNMLYIDLPHGKTLYRLDGVTERSYQPHKVFRYVFVSRYWLPFDERRGVPSITVALEALEKHYEDNPPAQLGET